jgi:hypothetical protein
VLEQLEAQKKRAAELHGVLREVVAILADLDRSEEEADLTGLLEKLAAKQEEEEDLSAELGGEEETLMVPDNALPDYDLNKKDK